MWLEPAGRKRRVGKHEETDHGHKGGDSTLTVTILARHRWLIQQKLT